MREAAGFSSTRAGTRKPLVEHGTDQQAARAAATDDQLFAASQTLADQHVQRQATAAGFDDFDRWRQFFSHFQDRKSVV